MLYLLMHATMFASLPNGCYLQLSGMPASQVSLLMVRLNILLTLPSVCIAHPHGTLDLNMLLTLPGACIAHPHGTLDCRSRPTAAGLAVTAGYPAAEGLQSNTNIHLQPQLAIQSLSAQACPSGRRLRTATISDNTVT